MAKKSAKKAAKQKRQAQNQARSQAQANKNANNNAKNSNNNSNSNNKHIQQLTAKMENISLQDGQLPPLSLQPSGLNNLGSTCYFNSVMQVLAQTYDLQRKLQERSAPQYQWEASTVYLEVTNSKKEEEDNECNESEDNSSSIEASFKADSRVATLPEPHALITAFVKLQREIFTGSRTFPHALLSEIRREHAQFMGWNEQDAQELLISLLSSMKKLEAERQKTVLSTALGIENPRRPTPEEQQLAQRFKIAANHTVVDAIFGGQLLCCIRCTECNHRSFTFETFMDLSLSLNTTADQSKSTGNGMKKFVNSGTSLSTGNSNSRNKGYKNKKNKSNHHKVEDFSLEEADAADDENVSPMMDAEEGGGGNDEEGSNRNMTTRERKEKRAAKKAAKRQARQIARDQAAKDQDRGYSLPLQMSQADEEDDSIKSGGDEDEEEEVDGGIGDDDDDQDSTGAVDGGTSSPELLDPLADHHQATTPSGAVVTTAAAISAYATDETSLWPSSQDPTSLSLLDHPRHHHQTGGSHGVDLHQVPMDITGDLDDYDLDEEHHQKGQRQNQYPQRLNFEGDDDVDLLMSGLPRNVRIDDANPVALASDPSWGYADGTDNAAMDIGSGSIGAGGGESLLYNDGGIDWSADPASYIAEQLTDGVLMKELLGVEGGTPQHTHYQDRDHLDDLVIESILSTDIQVPTSPSQYINDDGASIVYGPQLPPNYNSGDYQTMATASADSGIGGSVTTVSSTTSTLITKSPEHHQPEVDVFASGDSMDGVTTTNSTSSTTTNSPNGKSGGGSNTKLHNSSTPILLPHVDPFFRSKLYDLALQKVSYDGGVTNVANGDLGRLFEAFIKPETLDGVNKYLCDGCTAANAAAKKKGENSGDISDDQQQKKVEKVYTKAVRTQLIALPPAVLVVHLKRFEANSFGGSRSGGSFTRGAAYAHKLSTSISFPERLSLAPYTSKLYEMAYAKFYEFATEDDENGDSSKLEYQLYGVVLHSGSLRSGHYTAYVAVRPAAYNGGGLERFLHLKPFVANIEHIVGVCFEEQQKQQQKQEETKVNLKKEEEMNGDDENCHHHHHHQNSHSTQEVGGLSVKTEDGGTQVLGSSKPKQEAMMVTDENHDDRHFYSVNANGDHNYLGDGPGTSGNAATPTLPPPLPPHRRNDNDSVGDQRKWYHISDTHVQQTNLATVLRETTSPYMLFYERIQ